MGQTQTFPDNFIWGTATASYQIEGAHNEDGRTDSIWDVFCRVPGNVANGDTGEIACDHYHKYADDIQLMKKLGVDSYRFSVSWNRILPDETGAINQDGVAFYNRLIDGLIAEGITPWMTFFHWDLPQYLQDKGGWENRDSVTWFTKYAATLAEMFGDRVKNFILINEPSVHAYHGHFDGTHAPGLQSKDILIKAIHHQNLAIAKSYRLLKDINPDWHIGSSYTLFPARPASDSDKDKHAATLQDQLWNGAFFDPVYKGTYPALLAEDFAAITHDDDMDALQTPLDFVGIQHYTAFYFQASDNALGAEYAPCPSHIPQTDMGWGILPDAFYDCLMRFSKMYGNPPVYITENGAAYPNDTVTDNGHVHDKGRVEHYKKYTNSVLRAITDGAAIKGYFAWSMLDNFEWGCGFDKRFGLVHVDYKTLKRTPKDSFLWYKDFIQAQRKSSISRNKLSA